jgi:hypothetical protein
MHGASLLKCEEMIMVRILAAYVFLMASANAYALQHPIESRAELAMKQWSPKVISVIGCRTLKAIEDFAAHESRALAQSLTIIKGINHRAGSAICVYLTDVYLIRYDIVKSSERVALAKAYIHPGGRYFVSFRK